MTTKITAELNHLRIAPRKVRAVVDMLRGLDADAARAQLKYLTKRSARPLEKLLNSAIANAKHNLGWDENYIYIKEIRVDEGIKLKRYKPKGFGMTMPIQKKTSRVKLVLDELSGEKRKKKEARLVRMKKFEPAPAVSSSRAEEEKPRAREEKQKPKIERKIEKVSRKGTFGEIKTLGRKLFRRKSI